MNSKGMKFRLRVLDSEYQNLKFRRWTLLAYDVSSDLLVECPPACCGEMLGNQIMAKKHLWKIVWLMISAAIKPE